MVGREGNNDMYNISMVDAGLAWTNGDQNGQGTPVIVQNDSDAVVGVLRPKGGLDFQQDRRLCRHATCQSTRHREELLDLLCEDSFEFSLKAGPKLTACCLCAVFEGYYNSFS